MRVVESVLSPKPDNNIRSSVLWSERNVRSIKPIPMNVDGKTSLLNNLMDKTFGFVRRNVFSLNSLSLFAGITCMVAVVLAVWAIYMFKEQKAKMRNLQNMVVDMTLTDAKQRNGGIASSSSASATASSLSSSAIRANLSPMSKIGSDVKIPAFTPIADFGNSRNDDMKHNQAMKEVLLTEESQMNELRKVQAEVAKLLTNPVNIMMEKPVSRVTIEEITDMQSVTDNEVSSMVRETSEQKKRFESILGSYTTQMKEMPKMDRDVSNDVDNNEEEDDDFLRDIELYNQQEQNMLQEAEQLQQDLQMAMAV